MKPDVLVERLEESYEGGDELTIEAKNGEVIEGLVVETVSDFGVETRFLGTDENGEYAYCAARKPEDSDERFLGVLLHRGRPRDRELVSEISEIQKTDNTSLADEPEVELDSENDELSDIPTQEEIEERLSEIKDT